MRHVALMALLGVSAAQAEELSCTDLASLTIPASAVALPMRGVTIRSAELISPTERIDAPSGVMTPVIPEHCQVIGAIMPVDASAPSITFQLNLPTDWNGKALQFGGGGFNGTLVTGLGPAVDAPLDDGRILDARDHLELPAAAPADLDVYREYPLEALRPGQRPLPVRGRWLAGANTP